MIIMPDEDGEAVLAEFEKHRARFYAGSEAQHDLRQR